MVAGRGGLRVWLMAPVLLPVCFWLAWPWLPVQTVTRGIIVEFECLRSEQRTACLQQRHHEAEVRALKAIQDELQELTRERPSAQAAETDGRAHCHGRDPFPTTPQDDLQGSGYRK